MAQQIINTGAVANDGTGDPLRTAFTETNNNFTEIYTAGPVGSNVRIVNNTILTINTNGNLVLAPNGVGVVQSNVSIVPNQANVRNLGSSTQRWGTVYTQYLNVTNGTTVDGDLTVGGNLTVTGNTVQIGNLVTDAKTLQLANTANTANAASGSGITVGASDNIATLLYNSTGNVWTTNIGVSAVGNVTAGNVLTSAQVIANGEIQSGTGLFTGGYLSVNGTTDLHDTTITGNLSVNVIRNNDSTIVLIEDGVEIDGDAIVNGNITATNLGNIASINLNGNASTVLYGNGAFAATNSYGNANVTTLLGNLGSNVISGTGNITTTANVSGGYILGNGSGLTSLPAPVVTQDITSNGAMSIMTYDGTIKYVNYATVEPSSGNITGGNISATGNISGNYVLGNGSQLTGINASSNKIFNGNSYANIATANGNLVVNVGTDGYGTWTFETGTGNLVGPGNASQGAGIVFSADQSVYIREDMGGLKIDSGGGIEITTNSGNVGNTESWTFGADGTTTFPTANVDLHNGGVQSGQVLQFGNSSQQAIITGPTPAVDTNAQRLIIQGQRGNGTGEGGDVYVWGGDADTNGGDIKIYAGDADNVSAGSGGYVNLAGGAGFDNGGDIDITGGSSANGTGGDIFIDAGTGELDGGTVTIQAGYGVTGQGGTVQITGGLSGNGTGSYGNVVLGSGSIQWIFDNTGNLTLPSGGVVSEGASPSGLGNTIALIPSGASDADQQLLVYPTGNVIDGNHLHLTTGNLLNTELYLGNDDFYVKLANTGNITVNTAGNTAQWTFGTDSNLTFPTGNLVIIPDDPAGNIASIVSTDHPLGILSSGANGAVSSLWVEDIGNVGTSNIAAVYANPTVGSGIVRIAVGQNGGNTGPNLWDFDSAGNLSIPGNINFSGDASAAPSLNDFFSVTSAANFAIVTDSANTDQTWTFGANGNLTAPGNVSAVGNISGGNLSLSGNITSSIGFTGATITINNAPGGNEGAEVIWALPSAANTVLTTSLVQDVFQNGMRFFESGGNSRGLYMDLGNVPNGAGTAVGYRDIPQVSFTGNATLAATDAGRHYYSTLATANTLTIANNTSVSWTVGTAISVVNRGSGNITIAQGSGVSLYLAGNSTAANRTISTYGMATLLNVAANVWMINGTGVS